MTTQAAIHPDSPIQPADAAGHARPLASATIMLLISSLEHGGAERQVVELVRHLDRSRFRPFVCSLSRINPLAEFLPDPARDLVIIEKRWKFDISTVRRVAALMRERDVRLVHAFLFDAEMVARLAAPRAGRPVVIASERNTDYRRPWLHAIGQRLTLKRFDLMIANSEAGKRFNVRTLAIDPQRIRVVHNGVDTQRFCPGPREALRRELGIASDVPVVGMIAMFKRQKRHGDFFRMARRLLDAVGECRFLLAGEPLRDNQQGAADYHREVRRLADDLGVTPRCHFLGNRQDMPAVYRACDVTVLTSEREGTPNVLLESMACGVPVVATDIADNARIVPHERGGFIVPLGDVEAMARRVASLLSDASLRARFGAQARRWVCEQFSIGQMVRKTAAIYEELLRQRAAQQRERGEFHGSWDRRV